MKIINNESDKNILINATNLTEGGGVQVATSFLKDLVALGSVRNAKLSVYVSSAVNRNLDENFFNKKFFANFKVVDSKEINFLNSYKLNNYDVVFTIFGPMFLPFYKNKHISGLAQPWIVYPVADAIKKFTFLMGLLIRFKYFLAAYIFKRADTLIVESNHIKCLLIEKGYVNHIEVVENSVSGVFFEKSEWKEIYSEVFNSKKINLGILSAGYPHKNLDFVINLAEEIESIYPQTFNFIFTLPDAKFHDLTRHKKLSSLANLGVISLQECPSFYNQIDGVILPSLLECFSITPYESMLMNKVVFVSDRVFFKKSCFDHAIYFNPLSLNHAVSVIIDWYFDKSESIRNKHICAANKFVNSRCRSTSRAKLYTKIMTE
jgi:hypothetical protein